MSAGRCQPATTVEAPVIATANAPGTTTASRRARGATRRSAPTALATTVVCPLGRLLGAMTSSADR